MKSGTTEHIKFKRLKRALKLKQWECVGLLESLWTMTSRSHICGNIGKSTNEDIACAMEWEDDADKLIDALVSTGWLDRCKVNRLVVHNWSTHCPNHVKGNVSRHKKEFSIAVPHEVPSEAPANSLATLPQDTPTKSSQAKSNQTQPSQEKSSTHPLPREASMEDFFSAKDDKHAIWNWMIMADDRLTKELFSYKQFTRLSNCFKYAQPWFATPKIIDKLAGMEIQNKRSPIGLINALWKEIDTDELQKSSKGGVA